MMQTDADEIDAPAVLWCVRRGITLGYLAYLSGYTLPRLTRLWRLGEYLEITNGCRH